MTAELDLICDGCRRPIADDDGYLWVDTAEVRRTEEAVRAWEEERTDAVDGSLSFSGDDIFGYPGKVRWRAHHALCDPAPGEGAYDIPAAKIRSWEQLLDWTAHLMEKSWLLHTDWDDFLRGVHRGGGRLMVASQAGTPNP
ncbi:hypothetical protein ABT237_36805 [Streptomyces sp. NPDC001581]|uniref:hypothetical protein n=1 Tax=Streptomyces sp. NPDC001581 TaxID=3154386 RepID=UPI00331767F2